MGMNKNTDKQSHYQIKIKGHLDAYCQDWLDGSTILLTDDGDTILNGTIVDQAALYGVLKKIRDLGLTLISVNLGHYTDTPANLPD
jgi:hypothetical protein